MNELIYKLEKIRNTHFPDNGIKFKKGFKEGMNISIDTIKEFDENNVSVSTMELRNLLLKFMNFYFASSYNPANTTFNQDIDAFIKQL